MDHISVMERIHGLRADLAELNQHMAAPGTTPTKRHLEILDALHGLPDMIGNALKHFPAGHVPSGARVFDANTGLEVKAGTPGAVTEPNLKPDVKAVPFGVDGHVAPPAAAPAPPAVRFVPPAAPPTAPPVGENK